MINECIALNTQNRRSKAVHWPRHTLRKWKNVILSISQQARARHFDCMKHDNDKTSDTKCINPIKPIKQKHQRNMLHLRTKLSHMHTRIWWWLAGDDGVSGVHIPCLSVMNAYMICFLLLMMPIYWIRFCVRLVFILFRPSFPFFCLSVRNFVCFSLILLRKYACFIVNDSVSAVILSCRTWTEKTRRSLTSSTFSPGFRADQPTVNHFNIWSFVL